jgi:hypothetical protein
MIELMTKQFAKRAAKQKIPANELAVAISEMQQDGFILLNTSRWL